MVRHPTERVADLVCPGVLHHHLPVAVVNVHDGKGIGRQIVKEEFLAPEIFCKALVVVEMVVSQIGEDSGLEFKTCNPFLFHPYGAHLHETPLASFFHHLAHQRIDCQRVGCRIDSFGPLAADIVCNG